MRENGGCAISALSRSLFEFEASHRRSAALSESHAIGTERPYRRTNDVGG
jgi:hypothetical protein